MGKFFLEKNHQKIKKKPVDYKIATREKIYKLAKIEHLNGIQRIIRKLKDISMKQQPNQNNQKIIRLETQLKQYKAINKQTIKNIAVQALNQVGLTQFVELNQKYKSFLSTLNQSNILQQLLHKLISSKHFTQQAQAIKGYHQYILTKKTNKRQKSKLRKKRKLLNKNSQPNNIQNQQKNTQPNNKQQNNTMQNLGKQQIGLQQANKIYKKSKIIQKTQIPLKRTEFKKIGRNKYLKQKNQKKHNYKHHQSQQKYQKTQNLKQNTIKQEKLHPSWQAKLQSNKSIFIQPFQGKRILL